MIDLSYKAVTSASYVRNETAPATAIVQRLAKCGDVDPKIGFLDDCVGPDARDQLLFADGRAGALNQRYQNVERAAAERDGPAPVKQKPLNRQKPKWPERE